MSEIIKRLNLFKPAFSLLLILSCHGFDSAPSRESIAALDLKRGKLISCGPANNEFGTVHFEITAPENVQKDFNTAVELLHSFEYDESEKEFARIIDKAPACAMAYWGVAMCNFHPLWEPPTELNLQKGSGAIAIAQSIANKSDLESGFINAAASYYEDWNKSDLHDRSIRFEKEMQDVHVKYPAEGEAPIFYALALCAAADPRDKSYGNQKKAGAILDSMYTKEPNHPGIIHYLIHTYDYPGLAKLALPAAKRYASVAPSSAHAQHMPSHIFVRLGLWDDCIQSNLQSISSAACYAQSSGIQGHWDEELHGLDYLVYAYLQKGENAFAADRLNDLARIEKVYPENFKVAYAFAAIPSRIALENKNWKDASALTLHSHFPWDKFPWQEAIIHFARLLGSAHIGNLRAAKEELGRLNDLRDSLDKQKDDYKMKQVNVQILAGEAWISFYSNKKEEALRLMKLSADLEDSTEKHPVTPGEVLPARELYADMLKETKQYESALHAYQEVLQRSPNRFNSLCGVAICSEKTGKSKEAMAYYKQLSAMIDPKNCTRNEWIHAKSFLQKHK